MLLWFILFGWHTVAYPTYSGFFSKNCYSPNHEYYIKRYQTPFQAIQDQLYAYGYAILYDKTGKKLFEGKTYVGNDNPYWFDDSVAFMGSNDDWYVKLPSSPGAHPETYKGCFDEKSDYIAPRPAPLPVRKRIVKAVEPLVKTKAPYQLQFLIEDQHGIPFKSFYYLIISPDGSRQRGETDEHGRTFVIEAERDEIITFYYSPLQSTETFMLPEELERWCKKSPKECTPPENYTVVANTIRIEPHD